jgi:acyl-CoA reductase-like NAD-dependent aldehyde dehydrogenase
MTSMQARNLVDGLWQPAQSGRTAPSIDPSTQQILGSYAASGLADAEAAVAAARRPFGRPEWAQNARLRQLVMLRWADLMESSRRATGASLTLENGKPLAHSRGEMLAAARFRGGSAGSRSRNYRCEKQKRTDEYKLSTSNRCRERLPWI